jgi:hypothetical protein
VKTLSTQDEEHFQRLLRAFAYHPNNVSSGGIFKDSLAQREFAHRACTLMHKGITKLPERYPNDSIKIVDKGSLHSRMMYSLAIRVAKKHNCYVD